MLKLLKYEMRKTLTAKLIVFGLMACLEGLFLFYTLNGHQDGTILTMSLVMLGTVMAVLLIGVMSVVTLHRDMNTKQSYMLFMTPNSCGKILGAKALECTISVALTGAVFFGVCVADIRLLTVCYQELAEAWDFVNQLAGMVDLDLSMDFSSIALTVLNLGISWLETVMLAFFADILATALLKGKKLGGIVAFLLFLVVSVITGNLVGLITVGGIDTTLLVRTLAMLAIAVGVFFGASALMEKKLSV